MNPELILFIITSIVIVGCAIAMMTTKNVVHCVFYLLLALVAIAGIFMMLDAQFLAAAQVLIYAGAVSVLLLFIIMLTMTMEQSTTMRVDQSGAAIVVIGLFWVAMLFVLNSIKWKSVSIDKAPKTLDLAKVLFTKQILPFEVAGIILLVALVGAVYLAKEEKA